MGGLPTNRALTALLTLALWTTSPTGAAAVSWLEHPEAFFEDAPSLLVPRETREGLQTTEERTGFLRRFLADPLPDTPGNELVDGIERRLALMRSAHLTHVDARSQLLFLHGAPAAREVVECGQTFVPIEIWSYEGLVHPLVLYQPTNRAAYRLWLPLDSKKVLYTDEMGYWMEQWEHVRYKPRRFDLKLCPQTETVDEATGVRILTQYLDERPGNADLSVWLDPPSDLAAWSRRASRTPLPSPKPELAVSRIDVVYPERVRQRLVSRVQVELPAGAELGERRPEPRRSGDEVPEDAREVALVLEGVLEQEGALFESFRVRFRREPPPSDRAMALVFERLLRPGRSYRLRARLTDEVSGSEALLHAALEVPDDAAAVAEAAVPESSVVALAEDLARRRIMGGDAVMLVPAEEEIVSGPWRAEAVVTGTRIERVDFLLDGESQMVRTAPPYSVELRLAAVPRMQLVRVEGYDGAGEFVASDEVVLNQPRGYLSVRILEPRRGVEVEGAVVATAEVIVPPERRVERVEFLLDEDLVTALAAPPWEARIEAPTGDDLSYLAVVAHLDDGSRAEDLRLLNVPAHHDLVDVQLVEVYATVTDRGGDPVVGLEPQDFEVLVGGEPQEIRRFEPVEERPLTVGFVVDTSTSMASRLPEARRAAVAFLDNLVRPQDRAFVLTFADRAALAAAPTDDVAVIANALERMVSLGWTSLHDAVAAGLHVFRGARGRRAMILLTDGDDTASTAAFRDVLEFARRSGVVVYTVGLDVGPVARRVRGKLDDLATETGGRAFYISKADELAGVYAAIDRELRSQYLLAYSPEAGAHDEPGDVEVKVLRKRLKTRTTRSF